MGTEKKIEKVKEQNTRVRRYVSGVVSSGASYASSLIEKAKESARERRAKFIKKKHGSRKSKKEWK